jgi:hypothetical protein
LVGKPIGLLQSFKMKGTGSKRMIIDDVSINMRDFVNSVADATYANIELRPIGILIRINKGLRNFAWVIPYYQLVIYKTNGSSIHAQGHFIHFKNNITLKENKSFFDKMLNEKVKYDSQYSFFAIQ